MKSFVWNILLVIGCFSAVICKAEIINIGPKYIHSIKEGIRLAKPGDTLNIHSGTYHEGNIIIDKPLVLLGEDYPVIDGEGKFEIITVTASNVHIEGLRLVNTGFASVEDLAAIKVIGASGVVIKGNQLNNTFFGIYFANCSESIVENNQLQSYPKAEDQIGNGIHMWKCKKMKINHNVIHGHRDGIYFEFVTNSMITSNRSEGNMRYGLHFMFSHNDEYRKNAFVNNGAGVAVMFTKNVKMIGNLFEHNWGAAAYGLLLKEIQDSEVLDNTFFKNTVGIHMEGVSRTLIERNTFSENGYAVRLQASCDDNTFTDNNLKRNTFDLATNGTLVLNTITGNYWDKYEGYDLNKDGIGDVPFHPVGMYAMIVERVPTAVLLWRSFMVFLMDRAEKIMPAVTPIDLKDDSPLMKPHDFNN